MVVGSGQLEQPNWCRDEKLSSWYGVHATVYMYNSRWHMTVLPIKIQNKMIIYVPPSNENDFTFHSFTSTLFFCFYYAKSQKTLSDFVIPNTLLHKIQMLY